MDSSHQRDYILRRKVIAAIDPHLKTKRLSSALDERLPKGWSLQNGLLYFPAGELDALVVNGKIYHHLDDMQTLEEQAEVAMQDLQTQGFSRAEAEEMIEHLPVREDTMDLFLDEHESGHWLERFPDRRTNAIETLAKTIRDIVQEHPETSPAPRTGMHLR